MGRTFAVDLPTVSAGTPLADVGLKQCAIGISIHTLAQGVTQTLCLSFFKVSLNICFMMILKQSFILLICEF